MALSNYEVNRLVNGEPETSRVGIYTLDGVRMRLRFYWSTRDLEVGAWYVDIMDSQGEPLVLGHGVSLATDLFATCRYMDAIPGGQLFPFDPSGSGIEPGLRDFIDGRVLLVYRPAAEVVP